MILFKFSGEYHGLDLKFPRTKSQRDKPFPRIAFSARKVTRTKTEARGLGKLGQWRDPDNCLVRFS